jgi:protease I
MSLHDKHVAILIAPRGTEDSEFSKPRDALRQAGVKVTVIGLEAGTAQTFRHDLDPAGQHAVDITIGQANAADYDAVVIPGGTVGADRLRADAHVVALVRAMVAAGKPVAAICHGPWVLAEAGLAHDRAVTSYPSLQTDLHNAGGQWQDKEVVVDRGVITSRRPDDLPAFNQALLDALAQLPG